MSDRLNEAIKKVRLPMDGSGQSEHLFVVVAAARAYADLVNGERVEWCEEHRALEAVEEDPGFCWRYDGDKPCRIVPKLLVDPPKEETM